MPHKCIQVSEEVFPCFNVREDKQGANYSCSLFISCKKYTRRHNALSFGGGGEGSSLSLTMFTKGT